MEGTTSIADFNLSDLIAYIERHFNRSQATGLACLIFLSLREQTSVVYQHDEWAFTDIPEQIVKQCDALTEDDLLSLTAEISVGLLEEIAADTPGDTTNDRI